MQGALYLEINAVGIVLLMVILWNRRHQVGSSAAQRQFNILIFTGITMLAFDAACWLVDGKVFPFAREISYTFETVYFMLHMLLPYTWVLYTEYALNAENKSARRRIQIAAIPILLSIIGLFVNIRYGIVFFIDENNVYHRALGVYIYAILAYGYLIYASVRALAKAKHSDWVEDKRRYYAMAFFVVPPFIGGLIQLVYYGVNLTWFLATISILEIYIDSQNRQISTDPLTGLNNRRELIKFLLRETREHARNSSLRLIMMDVDGFKQINDTCGHYYGDGVLTAVSDILKTSCRSTEAFLARYGGDEFCIALPSGTEIDADSLVERIQEALRKRNELSPEAIPVGISFGCAEWDPQQDRDYDSRGNRADQAMYQAKNAKKRNGSSNGR